MGDGFVCEAAALSHLARAGVPDEDRVGAQLVAHREGAESYQRYRVGLFQRIRNRVQCSIESSSSRSFRNVSSVSDTINEFRYSINGTLTPVRDGRRTRNCDEHRDEQHC